MARYRVGFLELSSLGHAVLVKFTLHSMIYKFIITKLEELISSAETTIAASPSSPSSPRLSRIGGASPVAA